MALRNPHLAVIGDREALVWVLENLRVAFPQPRYHHIFPTLETGDVLYLYTTRGCYKNPTRDRGLVIGSAAVTAQMGTAAHPLRVRGRELPLEAPIEISSLAPVGEGIDLAAEVAHMTSFPKPETWSVYLRRSLFRITEKDAKRFDRMLEPHAGAWDQRLAGYRHKAKVDAS